LRHFPMRAVAAEEHAMPAELRETPARQHPALAIVAADGAVGCPLIRRSPDHERNAGFRQVAQPLVTWALAKEDESVRAPRGDHRLIRIRIVRLRRTQQHIVPSYPQAA